MAAKGYMFLLRCDDVACAGGKLPHRQGKIITVVGQNRPDPPRPEPTLEDPKPALPDPLPPIPTTRVALMGEACGSHYSRQNFALIFVRGMTVAQYVRHLDRLKELRVTRADLVAMMPDEQKRNRVRRLFNRTVKVDHADVIAVDFSDIRTLLRNNDDDDSVVLVD